MIVLDVKFDRTRGLEEVMISDHRNFFFFHGAVSKNRLYLSKELAVAPSSMYVAVKAQALALPFQYLCKSSLNHRKYDLNSAIWNGKCEETTQGRKARFYQYMSSQES